jgi:hypothetical protein
VPELDIQAILRELVEGEVEFLLIDGVAVGYHGHIRATKDVDLSLRGCRQPRVPRGARAAVKRF